MNSAYSHELELFSLVLSSGPHGTEARHPDVLRLVGRERNNERMYLFAAGLTTRELEEARVKYADYYEKHGKRPKENIKYTFEDKEQIDYIRDVTAKNVW